MKTVVIVGGGFAGLNAAKTLGNTPDVRVILIDRNNHHLFQPLLYQVATAGLSPAEIAVPLRSIFSGFTNIEILQGEVVNVDMNLKTVRTDFGTIDYDYLILSCGSRHAYFGNETWEPFAPGLKTIEQAIEIRRRILYAFEEAERTKAPQERLKHLTFVIVGGGPTGVELAGAIGEMSRYTLKKDFRNINPALTRIILIDAGPRILSMFSPRQSEKATRDLESLGVQVWTNRKVTQIDEQGVEMADERIIAGTVLWAAGVEGENLTRKLNVPHDKAGRVIVNPDLSVPGHPNVFAAGDQANFSHQDGRPLPGLSPVALQQGIWASRNILSELEGRDRQPFHYVNKGQMATIGKKKAVADIRGLRINGFTAWIIWLLVHIYYIIGFNNRLFILFKWATSYVTNKKGARLIIHFN